MRASALVEAWIIGQLFSSGRFCSAALCFTQTTPSTILRRCIEPRVLCIYMSSGDAAGASASSSPASFIKGVRNYFSSKQNTQESLQAYSHTCLSSFETVRFFFSYVWCLIDGWYFCQSWSFMSTSKIPFDAINIGDFGQTQTKAFRESTQPREDNLSFVYIVPSLFRVDLQGPIIH